MPRISTSPHREHQPRNHETTIYHHHTLRLVLPYSIPIAFNNGALELYLQCCSVHGGRLCPASPPQSYFPPRRARHPSPRPGCPSRPRPQRASAPRRSHTAPRSRQLLQVFC